MEREGQILEEPSFSNKIAARVTAKYHYADEKTKSNPAPPNAYGVYVGLKASVSIQSMRHGSYRLASLLLYAPDYVINAGGVIDILHQRMDKSSNVALRKHIEDIDTTLKEIYTRADAQKTATNRVAHMIAEERFSLKG